MAREFRTTRNADGTVTVHDVPVFAESVDARGGGVALVHDARRMQRWLRAAERRFRETGYEAPLHLGHHGPGEQVQAAGTFRPTRLIRRELDGAKRWVLLADLRVRADAFDRVKRGDYLYRSVEIKPDLTELLSLALLDHEAPFHKLELLRVSDAPEHALTYAEGGMAMDPTDDKLDAQDAPKPEENMAESPDPAKSMADAMSPVLALLAKIAAKLGVDLEDGEVAGDPETPPAETAPSEAPSLAMSELRGQVVALTRKIEAQERTARLDATERRLRDAGFGDAEVKVYRDTVRKSGEAAGAGFVEGCLRVGGVAAAREPSSWLASGEANARGASPDMPAEVLAYADRGPEAFERAKRCAKNHKLTGSSISLADYLRFNVEV